MELKFELLQHTSYSPDLDPSDFLLFPNLKKWLGGQRFMWNEEVITKTDAYFEEFPKSYFLGRLRKVGEMLGKVYRLKRRLCWRIKKI